ncbi:MAG: hypothetical protein FWE08_03700 [Oscillospiraceae bacterium]|nr:hypothetical protein [Oscillospiraceae bacterium]
MSGDKKKGMAEQISEALMSMLCEYRRNTGKPAKAIFMGMDLVQYLEVHDREKFIYKAGLIELQGIPVYYAADGILGVGEAVQMERMFTDGSQ